MIVDPYFNTDNCVERLYNDYKQYGKIIVAVDFDDTVFDYHGKNFKYDSVLATVKKCHDLGFYICVFTGSPKDRFPMIEKFYEERGIKLTSINKNPFPMPFGNDGKMFFNILLDDRAGLGQAYEILTRVLIKIQMNNDRQIR